MLKCCNTRVFRLTIYVRSIATSFLVIFVADVINTYFMNINVLFHFEHKYDITIIIKCNRGTRLRLVAQNKSLKMIATSILGSTFNSAWLFPWDILRISVSENITLILNRYSTTARRI